jgi:hypothetical protein
VVVMKPSKADRAIVIAHGLPRYPWWRRGEGGGRGGREEGRGEGREGGCDSGFSVYVTITDLRYLTIPAIKPSTSSSVLTTDYFNMNGISVSQCGNYNNNEQHYSDNKCDDNSNINI